ncbi:MAG TPA: DNA-binding response regulator [Armatimonadota bacterium]|nr:DNA-binding response regulator [Armatimonadota bacterium]
MRLLLVEDEAAIACRTRESLEEAHYTVDWARDGVEALALTPEREYIQERVWNDDESYSNTISVRIRQLRQKVDDGRAIRLIHTVYGQGYVLRAPESEEDSPAGHRARAG